MRARKASSYGETSRCVEVVETTMMPHRHSEGREAGTGMTTDDEGVLRWTTMMTRAELHRQGERHMMMTRQGGGGIETGRGTDMTTMSLRQGTRDALPQTWSTDPSLSPQCADATATANHAAQKTHAAMTMTTTATDAEAEAVTIETAAAAKTTTTTVTTTVIAGAETTETGIATPTAAVTVPDAATATTKIATTTIDEAGVRTEIAIGTGRGTRASRQRR